MDFCFINPSKGWRPEVYELARHLPRNHNITILQPSDNIKGTSGFSLCENIYVKYAPSTFIPLKDSIITVPNFKKWLKMMPHTVWHDTYDLIHVCDYEYNIITTYFN